MEKKSKKKYKMFASKMREDLYQNLKLLSALEGRSVQTLLEDAVTEYLDNRKFSKKELPGGQGVTMFSLYTGDPKRKKDESRK